MKKCNDYFTYYNKNGLKAKIKVSKNAFDKKNSQFLIKFQRPSDEEWLYHYPSKKFGCHLEVINYILKNLETNNSRFKIL
jgi:hypothetical protein